MTRTTEDGRPILESMLRGSGVITIDGNELTVRILEELTGAPRPPGRTPEELIAMIEDTDGLEVASRAATVALQYFYEMTEAEAARKKAGLN